MSELLLVCGTGTGIGKTHFSAALLSRAARDGNVAGFKPIESGCALWDFASDHAQLAAASTFHVKHAPEYCLSEAVSPHLAARNENRRIELSRVVERVVTLAAQHRLLLVELAGGLFSPLNESAANVDLVRDLQRSGLKTATVLVAPNRLGALHDVGASTRAAAAGGVTIDGIVLNAIADDDLASPSNAAEMRFVSSAPVLGLVPWQPLERLADNAEISRIYWLLLAILSRPDSSR
ncbi:MAG: dethiobiotin synthase [Polyangiaceae bacterium]